MKKLLLSVTFVTLSIVYFLFWPEFKQEITCAPAPETQLQGCSPSDPQYDFSEVRFRAGLSWVDSKNFCIKTDTGCARLLPEASNEVSYGSPVPILLALIGSITLAALSTYAIALLTQKLIRK